MKTAFVDSGLVLRNFLTRWQHGGTAVRIAHDPSCKPGQILTGSIQIKDKSGIEARTGEAIFQSRKKIARVKHMAKDIPACCLQTPLICQKLVHKLQLMPRKQTWCGFSTTSSGRYAEKCRKQPKTATLPANPKPQMNLNCKPNPAAAQRQKNRRCLRAL